MKSDQNHKLYQDNTATTFIKNHVGKLIEFLRNMIYFLNGLQHNFKVDIRLYIMTYGNTENHPKTFQP